MKTLNRPTAHVPSAQGLAGLTSRTRRLWTLDLGVAGRERQDLLTELAELDLAIERLSIRAASGLFRPSDGALAEQCRTQLDALERMWGEPASTGSTSSGSDREMVAG